MTMRKSKGWKMNILTIDYVNSTFTFFNSIKTELRNMIKLCTINHWTNCTIMYTWTLS